MVRAAKSKIAQKEKNDLLYRAILTLKNEEECYSFFQDLCTISELRSMERAMRWPLCSMTECSTAIFWKKPARPAPPSAG